MTSWPVPVVAGFFPMMTYRHIITHDPEYAQEKELRNRVLRVPLGLTLSEDDLRGEDRQIHLVAMDEIGQVIGCVVVSFYENGAKLRQIAVDEGYRGRGIGTKLIHGAEQVVRYRNVRSVTLHARVTAREFFERLGYTATSKVFTELTIPHIAMEKRFG